MIGLTAALGLAAPAAASAQCPNADATPEGASAQALGDATACLINRERKRRGLRSLRPNRRLARAAQAHTADMVDQHYFSHLSKAGLTLTDRLTSAGYMVQARRWRASENLAWGIARYGTPRVTIAGWLSSPAHRRNILDRGFREIGVGTVVVGSAAAYTANFGYRRG